jgi:hypothetical protein
MTATDQRKLSRSPHRFSWHLREFNKREEPKLSNGDFHATNDLSSEGLHDAQFIGALYPNPGRG